MVAFRFPFLLGRQAVAKAAGGGGVEASHSLGGLDHAYAG